MKNGNLEVGDVHTVDLEVGDVHMVDESAERLLEESTERFHDHRVTNEASHTDGSSPSIFMVPRVLRDLSPSSFNPQLVAIGPLHREDENMKAFERRKSSYVSKLMSRISYPPKEILKLLCMNKAYTSLSRIKACYVWTKTYSDADIAEMMVKDACFILGYMVEVHIFVKNNPHSGTPLQMQTITHDLFLLENQIPLFFLNEIFQCTLIFAYNISLIDLIHPFLSWHNPFRVELKIDNDSISNAHHIFSLLHQCYIPPYRVTKSSIRSKIHSAIDLDRAGVNFKPNKDPTNEDPTNEDPTHEDPTNEDSTNEDPTHEDPTHEDSTNEDPTHEDPTHEDPTNEDPTWVMAMKVKQHRFPFFFAPWSKPTLTMPILEVHDSTEFILRNLIAYEQSFQTHECYVSSYATIMDMLVNTQEDVAKLVKSGVLHNIMGSNKEAASMINSLCKHVSNDSFYEEEWEKLDKYCNRLWPKHIAMLKSIYFSSPWQIIALVAGIILFVLQVVQTIYTIKSS